MSDEAHDDQPIAPVRRIAKNDLAWIKTPSDLAKAEMNSDVLRDRINAMMELVLEYPELEEQIEGNPGNKTGYRSFSRAKLIRFLALFSLTGRKADSSYACGSSHVTINKWIKENETISNLTDMAHSLYTDVLMGEAFRRAVEGVEEPVYQKGELAGYITRYSDKLLERLLAKADPIGFGNRAADVNINLSGGVVQTPIALTEEGSPLRIIHEEDDETVIDGEFTHVKT